jgi:Tfp pilus assembly protein PilN
MINLLSEERKEEIRAARLNLILTRYIVIILMAIAFLMGVLFVSYTLLQNTKQSADSIVQSNDVKADVYSQTKQQVDALSAKLSQTKSTLDQEISYSKVLTTIGQLMPTGTILDSLNLDSSSFNGTPVDLHAYAKTNDDAVALRARLQSSPLFVQVNLKGTDSSNGTDGYPISVNLTVVFNRAGVK